MAEQLLNLAWVAIAIGSFAMLLPRRRDVRAIAAVAFMLALLFPIVSVTDDMTQGDQSLEQAVAVLAVIAIAFVLTVVARLELESRSVPAFLLAPEAGTRAPPRR
jgi:predicted neutral ceramidase superfamily lipid hydrolase